MEASADFGRSFLARDNLQIAVLVGDPVKSPVIFVTVLQGELTVVRNIDSRIGLLHFFVLF